MQALKYLAGYPEDLQARVRTLMEQDRLGKMLGDKYGEAHTVRNDRQLYEYTVQMKDRYLRKAEPLSKVVYDNKLHVVKHALGTHTSVSRVQGGKLKASREIRIATVFRDAPADFLKMIVAHELAHLLLDFSDCGEKDHERLCHAFAGALLLPEKIIREEFGGVRKRVTQWELKKLKGIYGISMQAIMARAHTLGIIDDRSYRLFRMHVSKHGWRKEEPGEYSGKEKANRFKQLVLHAAAEQVISYSKGAELLGLTLAEFEREVLIVS